MKFLCQAEKTGTPYYVIEEQMLEAENKDAARKKFYELNPNITTEVEVILIIVELVPIPTPTTTRRRMRGLLKGDTFFVYGKKHVAAGDSHLSGDSTCDEFIVYDENGDSWFETDFP